MIFRCLINHAIAKLLVFIWVVLVKFYENKFEQPWHKIALKAPPQLFLFVIILCFLSSFLRIQGKQSLIDKRWCPKGEICGSILFKYLSYFSLAVLVNVFTIWQKYLFNLVLVSLHAVFNIVQYSNILMKNIAKYLLSPPKKNL